MLKHHLQRKQLCSWKEKESQGRIARVKSIDHRVSSSYLDNLKLSDNLVKFVTKARLQLLECNSLLHLYYPLSYSKRCMRCNFHSDTVSHVLNGCKKSKGAIQTRHNRIVDIIATNLHREK